MSQPRVTRIVENYQCYLIRSGKTHTTRFSYDLHGDSNLVKVAMRLFSIEIERKFIPSHRVDYPKSGDDRISQGFANVNANFQDDREI